MSKNFYDNAVKSTPLRDNQFSDAMKVDELSLLKRNDKIEIKGAMVGNYTFISRSNEKVVLIRDSTNRERSYHLSDLGILPYENNLWNGSNYILSRNLNQKE